MVKSDNEIIERHFFIKYTTKRIGHSTRDVARATLGSVLYDCHCFLDMQQFSLRNYDFYFVSASSTSIGFSTIMFNRHFGRRMELDWLLWLGVFHCGLGISALLGCLILDWLLTRFLAWLLSCCYHRLIVGLLISWLVVELRCLLFMCSFVLLIVLLLFLVDIRFKANAIASVDQSKCLGTGHPVTLGRSNTTRTRGLQFLVELTNVIWNLSTILKVESLHISHRLIDTTDRFGVTDRSFGTIARTEVAAVYAADANLTRHQLLCSFGVTSRYIFLRGGEDFNHFRTNITLAVRK